MTNSPLDTRQKLALLTASGILAERGNHVLAKRINGYVEANTSIFRSDGSLVRYTPGHHSIYVGDRVRISPSQPKKRDGFIGVVTRIEGYGEDKVTAIHVKRDDATKHVLPPERVNRTLQVPRAKKQTHTSGGN